MMEEKFEKQYKIGFPYCFSDVRGEKQLRIYDEAVVNKIDLFNENYYNEEKDNLVINDRLLNIINSNNCIIVGLPIFRSEFGTSSVDNIKISDVENALLKGEKVFLYKMTDHSNVIKGVEVILRCTIVGDKFLREMRLQKLRYELNLINDDLLSYVDYLRVLSPDSLNYKDWRKQNILDNATR